MKDYRHGVSFVISFCGSSVRLRIIKLYRNQQTDNVFLPEIIMVFHFEKSFIFRLCGLAIIEKFTLSKAVLYHLWKIELSLKTLKKGLHGAWGSIDVRIWSSWFVQIGRKSKCLFATPRTLNL